MKVMMSPESVYIAEQELKRFEKIMNTQEYLTQEEYDFCFDYDPDIRNDTSLTDFSNDRKYINFRVYSEHDHEKKEWESDLDKNVYDAFEKLVKESSEENVNYVLKNLVRKYSYLDLV